MELLLQYRENFHELQRLIGDIDKIVSEKNVEFSIFASSDVLSDNIRIIGN